jgi:hypothetical protein
MTRLYVEKNTCTCLRGWTLSLLDSHFVTLNSKFKAPLLFNTKVACQQTRRLYYISKTRAHMVKGKQMIALV